MGEGNKLPESERPDIKYLASRLDSKVSKSLQNIFVLDLQNDCACSTESYDIGGYVRGTYYLTDHGIESHLNDRLVLPMLSDISEMAIKNLLTEAISQAGNTIFDVTYRGVIYNPNIDVMKLNNTIIKYCGIDSFLYLKSYKLESISEDFIYFIPDQEYFRVISVNLGGFGAFCFAQNIWKVPLEE